MVLAKVAPYIPRRAKYAALALPLVCLAAICGPFPGDWVENQWWMQAFMIYPPLVLAAATWKDHGTAFDRAVNFLGQSSFAAYLWHCPLYSAWVLVQRLLGVQPTGTRWEMLLFLLAVELLGAVLFTLVEKPLAQYSRRWEWDKLKIVDPV